MQQIDNKQDRDPILWEIAEKRASFKNHVGTYIVVIGFLWSIWFFTGGRTYGAHSIPWPVYPMLGWGIGLAFHFFGAYVYPKSNSTQREYERMINKRK